MFIFHFSSKQKYTAPELFDAEISYGTDVDIYSLSLVFYEMFSGRIAFEYLTPHQLIAAICIQKKRPSIDSTFPAALKHNIELGWSHNAADRCKLNDFDDTLKQMQCQLSPSSNYQTPSITQIVSVSMEEQAKTTQINLLQYSQTIEMKWPTQSEATTHRIDDMMKSMLNASSFRTIFNVNIVNATRQVQKHLFFDMANFKSITGIEDDSSCLEQIYKYNKAQRVNQNQNMSSTEITCAQLSLIPLNAGDRVLFLGAKGGYIQTIAAQIVGLQGEIWICSQDQAGIEHIENVRRTHIPIILRQIIKCVLVDDSHDTAKIERGLELHIPSIRDYFNAILVCGTISEVMLDNFEKMLKMDGHLLAPLDVDENSQKFTILHKTRDNRTGQVTLNKRTLKDWGVVFQSVQ